MPIVTVTTKSAEQVWKSPDGQRIIHKVELDYNGQVLRASTFSQAIATVGWTGEVESYEKAGRNGNETFVKQPAKEGFQGGSSSGSPAAYNRGAPRDDRHIKAQWAIGQAMTMVDGIAKLDFDVVEDIAQNLFLMVDRVKQAIPDAPETPEVPTAVQAVFKDAEPITEKELPWPNP